MKKQEYVPEVYSMKQSVNVRQRTFVKSCWNCNECSLDPDQELEGTFCMLDGVTVYPSLVCPDWKLKDLQRDGDREICNRLCSEDQRNICRGKNDN